MSCACADPNAEMHAQQRSTSSSEMASSKSSVLEVSTNDCSTPSQLMAAIATARLVAGILIQAVENRQYVAGLNQLRDPRSVAQDWVVGPHLGGGPVNQARHTVVTPPGPSRGQVSFRQ